MSICRDSLIEIHSTPAKHNEKCNTSDLLVQNKTKNKWIEKMIFKKIKKWRVKEN